mmetsp:Transcript_338/g.936  ORF Transcript_338/g.936 Transcript_338/m.936 type:complete len:233 (+) Transcript_338:171-869(+)
MKFSMVRMFVEDCCFSARSQTRDRSGLRRPLLESESVIAVARRVVHEVLLILVVGGVKVGVRHDGRADVGRGVGRDDLVVDRLLQLRDAFLGDGLLLRIGDEDDGRVLRAGVVALAVHGGGVVEHEEEADELLHHLFGRFLELHVEHLDVSRGSRADLSVGRILHGLLSLRRHEADLDLLLDVHIRAASLADHLGKVLDEVLLGSPVASCSEGDLGGHCAARVCHFLLLLLL